MNPQHRLTRIQLVNWGTFSHYHDLPVPRAGMLVTGPSGSGKSTLLDAMATLLVPPKWSSFNAAAQQSGRGDRARTVASYIRGAYRRDTDEASGQVAVTYLRKDATWSGVALTYTHDDGRVTTIGQLFHLQRGQVSAADVKHFYFQAPESVDLIDLRPYAENGIDQRRLKAAQPAWKYAATHAAFAAQLYRRFNLSGEQALRLLHKTQSSKNLNNLNTLLREFMLDQPDTFALADQAVDQFAELSTAHAAVVDARKQLEVLSPLRELVARYDQATEQLSRVQNMLARELRVDRDRLRFAGELIDVLPGEAAWQGPIERVLRPLAQTLLVPEDLYRPLAELVDSTGLGTRLVYARMVHPRSAQVAEPLGRSLLRKIDVVAGEQQAWLWERLLQQYDYDCVDTAADLVGVVRGVTAAGQVKHSGSRHEKDDRTRLDDRSRWILGSSVEAKQAAVVELLTEATDRVRRAEAAVEQAQSHRDRLRDRQGWLGELAELTWTELDAATAQSRLAELEADMERRRAATSGLAELERELAAAANALEEAHRVRRDHETNLARNADHRAEAENRLNRWRTDAAQRAIVPDAVREQLVREWPVERLAVERIDAVGHNALRAITDRRVAQQSARDRASNQAGRVMVAYKRDWQARAADLAAEMAYAPDFLAVLDELEADGLPKHEDRFFTLLQSQSRNNIGALSLKLKNSRREIRQRIDPINVSLRRTDFAPSQHLEIKVTERALPAVSDFLKTLNEITSDSLEDTLDDDATRTRAEARFTRMKTLLDRLASQETADLQWRTQCLDTRLHVEFRAVVLGRDGRQTNVYEDSGGLSGGERQKLVTFCLAAALRYQLARDGANLPEYALVILDEAFDKTDPEFTRAGLEVFRAFGFQLLQATPLKMLQTLEDYVGGVAYVSNPDGSGSRLAVMPFEEDALEPPAASSGSGVEVEQGLLL